MALPIVYFILNHPSILHQQPLPLLALSRSKPLLHPSDLPHLPPRLRSRNVLASKEVKNMFVKLLSGNGLSEEESWRSLLKQIWLVNRKGIGMRESKELLE